MEWKRLYMCFALMLCGDKEEKHDNDAFVTLCAIQLHCPIPLYMYVTNLSS